MKDVEFIAQVDEVKGQLFRIACLYLGSESAGMDAVDEAVYRAYRARHGLRQPEYFRTWLTRILINECKKELRRRGREIVVEELPEQMQEQLDHLPLKEAVAALPEELRIVVILRYFTGLTQAETAQQLDIPQGTVATRQRRALQLLRLELQEDM